MAAALLFGASPVAGQISTLVTDDLRLATDSVRHVIENVGAQIDFRIFALSCLELTLSVGQAFAFEKGRDTHAETMVSLKILK